MTDSSDEEAFDWGPGLDDDDDRVRPVDQEAGPREPGVWLTAVLGGVYVMWALAWVIGLANQPQPQFTGVVDAVMASFGQFLCYVATPLWFVAVLWMGAEWSPRKRGGVLLLGLLVLMPWPFVLPAVLA